MTFDRCLTTDPIMVKSHSSPSPRPRTESSLNPFIVSVRLPHSLKSTNSMPYTDRAKAKAVVPQNHVQLNALESKVWLTRGGPKSKDQKMLGLTFAIHPDTNEVVVSKVWNGYSASGANIQIGDSVLAINNCPVSTVEQASELCKNGGDTVELRTTHHRTMRNVMLRRSAPTAGAVQKLGLGFGRDEQGRLAVTELFQGYEAYERLMVGDRVLAVNNIEVEDPMEATRMCTAALGIVDLRVITNRTNGEGVSRSNFNSSSNSADLDLSTGGQGGWMA